jgi:hypothetical protein
VSVIRGSTVFLFDDDEIHIITTSGDYMPHRRSYGTLRDTGRCEKVRSQFVCKAASRLLVLGLGVVARSHVDGLPSPDTSCTIPNRSHERVWLRLLSVHQREARKPVKDGDTCSSVDTQCEHGVDE